MSYQFDKDDAVGFAHWGGYEFKVYHDEMQFLYCPYCQGGGNRDEYTFSINICKTNKFPEFNIYNLRTTII